MELVVPKQYKEQKVLKPEERYKHQYHNTDFNEGDSIEIRLLYDNGQAEVRRGIVTSPDRFVKRHSNLTGRSHAFKGIELLTLEVGKMHRNKILENIECDNLREPEVFRRQSYPLHSIAAVYMLKPGKKV